MTDDKDEKPSGERDYLLLAVGALLFVTVLLIQDLGFVAVLPLLIGGIGLAPRGAMGPGWVILTVAVVYAFRGRWSPIGFDDRSPNIIGDLFFAVAVFVYVVSHVRLMAIQRHAVPPDARRERPLRTKRLVGRWLLPAQAARRGGRLGDGELVWLILTAPVFALVAYVLWLRVAFDLPPPELERVPAVWRVILVAWGALILLGACHVILTYLKRSLASRPESLLVMQDYLWGETRGEQRRVNAWLSWGRRKRERKDDR